MQVGTLKLFRDLVDSQSFSQAAEMNFVTQSAVSQQIRSLEEKFKARLVERVRGLLDLNQRVAKTNLPGDRHARRQAGKIFME